MFPYKILVFSIMSFTFISIRTQDVEIISNLIDGDYTSIQTLNADLLLMGEKAQALAPQEKVEIKLYYECLCPDCRNFDTVQLRPTVEKLASYLNLYLYPYGNAKTIDNGNGQYEFKCQHGLAECYGNKLHACAIDYLGNMTKAVFFNSCMMDYSHPESSNDASADTCAKSMNVDSEPIKQCAKGPRGTALLKYYGDESKEVGFHYVPYILINGKQNKGENLMRDVCAAFTTPPPECAQ